MFNSCLDMFYLIMGRSFISNEELDIVKKTCGKNLQCYTCRYYKEGSEVK